MACSAFLLQHGRWRSSCVLQAFREPERCWLADAATVAINSETKRAKTAAADCVAASEDDRGEANASARAGADGAARTVPCPAGWQQQHLYGD